MNRANPGRGRGLASGPVIPFAIAGCVVGLDQLTKRLVVQRLGPDQPSHRREMLGRVLAFRYVENTGVAFGLFRGQTILVTVMALVVAGAIVRLYRGLAIPSPATTMGCGLILGGAAGNLIDRFRLGYVVDFIAVSVWPKFNVADSAITAGALLLAWRVTARDGGAPREARSPRAVEEEQRMPGRTSLVKPDAES